VSGHVEALVSAASRSFTVYGLAKDLPRLRREADALTVVNTVSTIVSLGTGIALTVRAVRTTRAEAAKAAAGGQA
jgi:hypothetical protein